MIVKGVITSKQTGETMPGAQVYISDAAGTVLNPPRATSADVNGAYSINANVGEYLTATLVGLQRKTIKVPSSGLIDFALEINPDASLSPIEVISKKAFNWQLWISLLLITGGILYFSVDFLKYKKVIA